MGQGRAREGVPDSNIFPIVKPETTKVTPNQGILSVMDDSAQEVPRSDFDSRVLGGVRLGAPRILGCKVGGAGLPDPCILGGGEWGP